MASAIGRSWSYRGEDSMISPLAFSWLKVSWPICSSSSWLWPAAVAAAARHSSTIAFLNDIRDVTCPITHLPATKFVLPDGWPAAHKSTRPPVTVLLLHGQPHFLTNRGRWL